MTNNHKKQKIKLIISKLISYLKIILHYIKLILNKQLTRYIYILIISIACISTIIFYFRPSKPGIASYDTYIEPASRITKKYNPEYSRRFHPNKANYLRLVHINVIKDKPVVNNITKTVNKSIPVTINKRILTKKHHVIHKVIKVRKEKPVKVIKQNRSIKKIIKRERVYKNIKYTITKHPNYHIRYLQSNYPIWSKPYVSSSKLISSTNSLYNHEQMVKPYKKAKYKNHVFYKIKSGKVKYGWVPKAAIKHSQLFQMPFHYYSQLQPYYAPDACEAVSLRMALSIKGLNPHIPMAKFIKRIPVTHNPDTGYSKSPFKLGDGAAIYPPALAKYARRYDKHAYAYTGISKSHLIHELKQGNPIIYEGSYEMKDIDSDHTLVLIGYCRGDLEFADPYYKKGWPNPISWVSIPKFTRLFHQPLRGARAVVIK